MQTQTPPQPMDYAKAIAKLVSKMPVEYAAQVYNFVRFLETQPLHTSPIDTSDDDWLNDSEEQMQAEDAKWDATYARHHDKFTALIEAAYAEIAADSTQPMFDERGEFML